MLYMTAPIPPYSFILFGIKFFGVSDLSFKKGLTKTSRKTNLLFHTKKLQGFPCGVLLGFTLRAARTVTYDV